ncbi:MAG: hypothetical protein C4346_16620, partial [Chloroflexota bacterium]
MNVRQYAMISDVVQQTRAGRMSRRDAIRLLGGVGLGLAGLTTLGRRPVFAQEGTPPAVATPQVGKQPDGSTLWRVKVGDMMMAELIELHTFFPSEITFNAGDSIWFDMTMQGFHTVTFPMGGEVPPLLVPDPEAATPTAGPPKLIFNPHVVFPAGGPEFDGTAFLNSGIDVFRDPSQPLIVKFTTPGSFNYLCVPHASVMHGKVNVVESGAALPMDQAAYDQAAADEMAKLYEQGRAEKQQYAQATATQRPDGTTLWEATMGAGGATVVRVQAILPNPLEIKVGDTVKWVNRSPGEPHTVTIVGAGATPPEDTLVESFADGTPKFVQNPATFLPQGGNTFAGTGFVNSGFTGIPQLGLPMDWECTFTAAGEFTTYCALHGDAKGNGMAAKL